MADLLKAKVAVITGPAVGIGRGVPEAVAEAGANIVALGPCHRENKGEG